jgi:hypothetical protein
MRDQEILTCWRTERRVPFPLTAEETEWLWTAEQQPYAVREETVKEYGAKFRLRTLIETGTYKGDMIRATLNHFDRLISIELANSFYHAAKQQFSPFPHISIVHGDSAKALSLILERISEPCLFWLDGHYSPTDTTTARGDSDTPIMGELDCILHHRVTDHVILIDDARCFIGPNPVLRDYPTIEQLENYVISLRPNFVFEVRNDIIRIHKK